MEWVPLLELDESDVVTNTSSYESPVDDYLLCGPKLFLIIIVVVLWLCCGQTQGNSSHFVLNMTHEGDFRVLKSIQMKTMDLCDRLPFLGTG